jgi:hypothetical protein
MLLHTGLGQGTLGAEQALGAAVGWTSEESWEAGADWSLPLRSTFAVGATWIRVAGINWFHHHWSHRYFDTLIEWVTPEALEAGAGSYMVDHLALGTDATCSRTGVYAFEVRTCSVSWTIRVRNALWPTHSVWISKVPFDATTDCSVISWSTLRVRSTRTWVTRVHRVIRRCDHFRPLVALSEWISYVATGTLAYGQVVQHRTFCIESASTFTWVHTVLV